jgi:hypothetical protein
MVKLTKTAASTGEVAIPPNVLPVLRDHPRRHTGPDRPDWLFPTAVDPPMKVLLDVLRDNFDRARRKAGREHLTFQGLRGTGATLAALCRSDDASCRTDSLIRRPTWRCSISASARTGPARLPQPWPESHITKRCKGPRASRLAKRRWKRKKIG